MNKGKRKVQPKPLLYIDQPDYGDYDQQSEDYVVSQIKSTKEEKKEIIASEKVKEKATKLIGTEKEKEQPQKKVEKVKKKRSDRKSFKDMAVEEKVDFIINLPQQLPRLTAEIVTEDKKVRGLIYDRDDNIIKIRTYQAPYNEELTINEIQAINIVSL